MERWCRPPRDEEDSLDAYREEIDKSSGETVLKPREDYDEVKAAEIYERRFRESFHNLDADLQRFDFQRGMIWLEIHAPSIANKVQSGIDELRAALTPPAGKPLDTDTLTEQLANVSLFLHRVAEDLRPCIKKDRKSGEGHSEPLLDRLADLLSGNQHRIVKYLWGRKGAGFNALAQIPGAFRDVPSDEAIVRALERIQARLNANPELQVTLSFSADKQRASINRPSDK